MSERIQFLDGMKVATVRDVAGFVLSKIVDFVTVVHEAPAYMSNHYHPENTGGGPALDAALDAQARIEASDY